MSASLNAFPLSEKEKLGENNDSLLLWLSRVKEATCESEVECIFEEIEISNRMENAK